MAKAVPAMLLAVIVLSVCCQGKTESITIGLPSSAPAFTLSYTIVMARSDWIEGHTKPIKRFLHALAQAEGFILSHPTEARASIQKHLNYDEAFAAADWVEHQFCLSLEQSLITAMEDEARWMIRNGLTTEKEVPDFVKHVYVDGLKAVRPEAVRIIR